MNHNQNAQSASVGSIAVALALVYVVWGSTFLAIHYALLTLPPFMLASLRFLIAGVAMYAVLRWRGAPAPTRAQWLASGVVGALLLAGGNGNVVWAQQTVPSGLASVMISVVPLWMAVFEWMAPRGQRPTWWTWVGLLAGFAGLVVMLDIHTDSLDVSPAFWALIAGPVFWASGSVVSKRVPLPRSPMVGTATQMVVGGLVLCLMSALSGELVGFHFGQVSAASWGALTYLTLAGSMVGFTAYVWLLKNAPLPLVATYAYVNPLVAVLLGWLFLGEMLTLRTACAGALILVSVALTGLSLRKES
jgi:drug/metabolite transporter (DMT)-like permease